jgi:hypothetical protein
MPNFICYTGIWGSDTNIEDDLYKTSVKLSRAMMQRRLEHADCFLTTQLQVPSCHKIKRNRPWKLRNEPSRFVEATLQLSVYNVATHSRPCDADFKHLFQ